MRKEVNRLKTFQMNPPWPKDHVDCKKLAKAGFFYGFSGDTVHCAFCRGQVCRWDREDDPMIEHARHFTTCPFIMGGDVGNEPLGEDPIPGPKRPRPYDVCGINNVTNYIQPTQYNLEITNQRVPTDNTITIDNNRQPEHSLPSVVNCRQILQDNQSLCHNPSSQDDANPSTVPPNHQLSGICKICYTNPIELVFLPCGHSVSCISCAQRLFGCPFCRATITTRIRTYLV